MRIDNIIKYDNQRIKAYQKKPIRNYFKIRKLQKHIQALEEGQRDALTTGATDAETTVGVVDKNNYKTYPSQVQVTYEMYNGRSNYGSEVLRGVIDTRVAFIGGEGINVTAQNPATKEYIEKFLNFNKLHGSRLILMIQTGEMEGKNLALLSPGEKDINGKLEKYIKVRSFSWWVNQYNIVANAQDLDEIKKITYRPKKENSKEISINIDKAVYVKLGGSEDRIADTSARVHAVLTDIENYSRAKYDMRKNNFLFGKVTPTWKVENRADAISINNDVNSGDFQIGKGYAGTGEMGLLEPTGSATESLIKDMLTSLKNVSMTLAIPIHWLAWPELMSNRATAENLLEVVNAGTIKERLLWEEGFTEIIQKSMILAIEDGFENNSILGDFQVKLPLISFATLKAIQETWIPLNQLGYVSEATVRNHIPGIDPIKEEKLLKKEKAKAVEESSLQNNVLNNKLKDIQEEEA